MIPQNLFDRLFGKKDESWVARKKSILDLVGGDVAELKPVLGTEDKQRLEEHLASVRDLERAIASLPPDYGKNIKEPEDVSDLTDYPKIAKIQSDLLVQAFPKVMDVKFTSHYEEELDDIETGKCHYREVLDDARNEPDYDKLREALTRLDS